VHNFNSVINTDPAFNTVLSVTNVPSFTNTGVTGSSVGCSTNSALVGVGILPVSGSRANSVVVTADVHVELVVTVTTSAGGQTTQKNNANSLSVKNADESVVKSHSVQQNNSALWP